MKDFISKHINDDIRRLALGKAPEGVDLRFALQQIDGRQRAKAKLPALASNLDIIFPVHLSVEQCSSEETAEYKTTSPALNAWIKGSSSDAEVSDTETKLNSPVRGLGGQGFLIDLTGGFGIDFLSLSKLFSKAYYVERNEELCENAHHNFPLLGLANAEIHNAEASDFLSSFASSGDGLVFIDPARRSESGGRLFAISDCSPDVITLMPLLKACGRMLYLKLSPMLDWHKAVADLEAVGTKVLEVHIVSVKNECKELLVLADLRPNQIEERVGEYTLFCKNDDSLLAISSSQLSPSSVPSSPSSAAPAFDSPSEQNHQIVKPTNPQIGKSSNQQITKSSNQQISKSSNQQISKSSNQQISKSPNHQIAKSLNHQITKSSNHQIPCFLLVPNASVMKAGCFAYIAERYNVLPADRNSHLFLSSVEISDFPGKQYHIESIFGMNKSDMRDALKDVKQANVAVRNFPLSADALRKRLKLKDGGPHYIFGTTINGEHKLILASL